MSTLIGGIWSWCVISLMRKRLRRDQLVWAEGGGGGENGVFTVKSAYHLAHEIGLREEGSCSKGTTLKNV
jgi:hypothetical protein